MKKAKTKYIINYPVSLNVNVLFINDEATGPIVSPMPMHIMIYPERLLYSTSLSILIAYFSYSDSIPSIISGTIGRRIAPIAKPIIKNPTIVMMSLTSPGKSAFTM